MFKLFEDTTLDDSTPQDYTIEKKDLGLVFRVVDMKILDARHARVTSHIWKD